MMDLISSFMNKNLDDFVKSYAGSILPLTVTDHETSHHLSESESENEIEQTQQNKDINVMEHKEYSQTESPPHLLSSNSFTAKSIAESITESNECIDDNQDENINDERNRKMYGEYGQTNFNLSVDILPMVSAQHTNITNTNNKSEADEQWTQLPNVVNTAKNNKKNEIKSLSVSANDSFLTNIAKEIELLDEELSSMGILTKANSDKEKPKTHSSDVQHAAIDQQKDNEEEIVIIKDKLSILRKSLVFKKNTKNQAENEDVVFSNENEKDAYFDPLVSPMKTTKMCSPEVGDYDQAIYHENATKIQKQWKKFQLKTLLINTFNRHLQQSKENDLALTITDLMASTTHQIVDHAEKLFSAVHDSQNNNNNRNTNTTIGNFSYGQLHFYGSPALDWSATYSMIESVVLRNLLYYKNSPMVKKIFDTQQILDDILSTQTDNKSLCSNVDNVLIDQLTTQLIQIKTELYKSCSNVDTQCNLNPLKLFPKNVNIFRSKHSQSNSTKLSPDKSMEYDNNSTTTTTETTSTTTQHSNNSSNTAKPEFTEIRSQLSLLRKSFSQRRRKVSKFRSSPKLSASLCSSIMRVNDEIDSLCITQQTEETQAIAQKHNDMYTNKPIFKFDIHTNSTKSFCMSQERPMTAPNRSVSRSPSSNNYRFALPEKKPYLKRKKLSSKAQKNIDWSHVKPRTVSRLSNNVRTARANNHRSHYKPNAINWKQRASSKVDCSWPTEKYRSTIKIKKQRNKNKIIPKKPANEFIDTYHNNTYNSNTKRNHVNDDKYLYYLKKGNKIGKISRDSAEAQLHDGSGSMILQTKQEEDNNSNVQTVSSSDIDNEFQSENQLKELQQTFAAIEKAMKQRRQQQHL